MLIVKIFDKKRNCGAYKTEYLQIFNDGYIGVKRFNLNSTEKTFYYYCVS